MYKPPLSILLSMLECDINNLSSVVTQQAFRDSFQAIRDLQAKEEALREALDDSTSLLGDFVGTEANQQGMVSQQIHENQTAMDTS